MESGSLRHDADMQSAMEYLMDDRRDIAKMTSRDLMHWFIDQNLTALLDDFKDVSGGHLYQMRGKIDTWLKDNESAAKFPVSIGGAADSDRKLNSLRSLGFALLERYPIEPEHSVPEVEKIEQAMSEQKVSHLKKWKRTVNVLQGCHKEYALWYQTWATLLTIFVVSLNAVVSSAMFSSISDSPEHSHESTIRILAAALSILSGVAAAVRSALRLETISEQHSSAARRFGKLYVRFNDLCDMLEVRYNDGTNKTAEWRDWFKDYMDVMEQAPMIKDSVYDAVCVRMDKPRPWGSDSGGQKTCRVAPEESPKGQGQESA
mmetsp:Transcript_78417/g.196949  ORF Transcript_78417/g.196949 Transcript_78417/m.196949 type:complete len:318 (+) Transcript_78417:72-1025(+)|eukprot:CAMPEP_0115346228 /NCGR_PEP_ID=MMETSP0270-20121206/94228_1 /TAXON_ID=71861 /ORGANISM="Scrippsiella trochoidea, Strain CCMP3099" /LENGTH=317 /DNA_ID=CAMNT_0002768055 /DNA_START=22 /DNA_END=975 /DNA_ORIENTATION=-